MTRRIIVTYVLLTAFALALLATPLGITFAHRERDRLTYDAERDADTIATMIDDPLEAHGTIPSSEIVANARRTGASIIVVNSHGVEILDSAIPGRVGQSLANAPDIRVALRGGHPSGRSELPASGATVIYASVPTTSESVVNGAVRVTYPTTTLDERVRDMWEQLALLCLAVLTAVALVGYILARGVTRPLRKLEHATNQLAQGDLSARVDDDDGPQELRRVATTFNRMASQLDDLLESQTQFVANASHQLRTPLTALRLRLENLEAGADGSDREAINAASVEVSRMSQLVDGLLLLARDSGDRARVEAVDIAAIARDRVTGWRDVARERDVEMVIDAPEHVWASALPGAPEQLLDNLIDNALNVSPPNGTITVSVKRRGGHVDIRVLDQGPGLDADARARAFDRFWRAPNAPVGGTGLGLAIVRQLAEASGGSSRLDERAEGGLAAEVTLPAAGAYGSGA